MTVDPLAHTLASALEELRRTTRDRAMGVLVDSAAWWLDVRSGTPPSASPWALPTAELSINDGRLTEAPYLAAIGYLCAIHAIPTSDAIAAATDRVLRRAAHTVERTGYADDPLVLGGLVLLTRALGREVTALRDAAEKILAADVSTATAALLTMIEPSVAAQRRPYGTSDVVDAAIAVLVASADEAVASKLFPTLDTREAQARIMAAACAGALSPASELERAFAAISLGLTIASAAKVPRPTPIVEAKVSEVDVAIIVALREEFRHLHASIPDATPIELGGHQYYRAQVGDYSVVAAFVGDMGPVPAAVASSRLIETWKPRNVILLGIAGGVSKDAALGDVVVGTQVDSYLDAGKAIDDENAFTLLPSGAAFRADRQLVSRVRNLEFTRADLFKKWQKACRDRRDNDQSLVETASVPDQTQLHDGTIASGPLVGASDRFRTWLLRRERGYKALEMEGGAVMWAAEQAWDPPHTLVVRGISDRADPGKAALDDVSKGAVRGWAMQNAIAFAWALLDAHVLVK